MKFLGCFIGITALLVVLGGAIAIATDFPGGGKADDAGISSSPPGVSGSATTTPETLAPTPGTSDGMSQGSGLRPKESHSGGVAATNTTTDAVPTPTDSPAFVDVEVNDPTLTLPTFPLASVEATYTESYQFGSITVRFRTGAYTEEYAATIAQKTVEALAEANQKLQTEWSGDMTVFLADQLFAEDCLGCQGFTESDFRWIFMLDDGSVVADEFEALLVHESAHLIAGNTIHLPFDIFYVEGLATWVMTDDIVSNGYLSPVLTTAWVYEAGALPELGQIMEDDFAGRMRKRIYYDAAASFAFFIIETYGWDSYISLYRQNPVDVVLGKSLQEIESEWHAYLQPLVGTKMNGVGATEWWGAAEQVIQGYGRFYDDPDSVTADQYRFLTLSRLALNRGDANGRSSF